MTDDDPIGVDHTNPQLERWFWIIYGTIFIGLNILMAWNQFA